MTLTNLRCVFLTLPAFFCACATPTSGVVPRGEGLFTVTRQGSSALVTTDSLKSVAILEADGHCKQSGKSVKVIHSKEIPAGLFGRWPESEVLFRCE